MDTLRGEAGTVINSCTSFTQRCFVDILFCPMYKTEPDWCCCTSSGYPPCGILPAPRKREMKSIKMKGRALLSFKFCFSTLYQSPSPLPVVTTHLSALLPLVLSLQKSFPFYIFYLPYIYLFSYCTKTKSCQVLLHYNDGEYKERSWKMINTHSKNICYLLLIWFKSKIAIG